MVNIHTEIMIDMIEIMSKILTEIMTDGRVKLVT
jgi:hypothetical protein